MPFGALALTSVTCNTSVVGNDRLTVTASKAAATVPTRYIVTIGRIWAVWLALRFAIADATSTSTSTGATAFSAETNRSPSIIDDFAAAGDNCDNATPATMPIAICSTRLPEVIRLISDWVLMGSR